MLRSIRFKLFLAFLITTSLIVAGMFFFTRWSLQTGMTELVQSREHERQTNLLDAINDFYEENQNWDKLKTNKRLWVDLVLQARTRRQPPFWYTEAVKDNSQLWPPTLSKENEIKRPPFEFRVMLLDNDKNIIYGRNDALLLLSLTPIVFKDNIVGFLGLLPGNAISQSSDVRFLEQQSKSFIWIALVMIILSCLLALFFAYILVKPIKKIIVAIQSLAVGKYDIKLESESTDEMGQLAINLNELAIALDRSEQLRRRWVADISHELRTPIAILRGELEALQDGIRPLTSKAIDSLFGDVMRLNRLTEDLYQLSITDHGALSYHKLDVDIVGIILSLFMQMPREYHNYFEIF